MERARRHGFLVLGATTPSAGAGVTDSELDEAETSLRFRFPPSYRAVLAAFGPGTFGEERWLLPPTRSQTYGSLLPDGLVRGAPGDWIVFAASDAGDHWAWSPEPSPPRSEPAVYWIPRGCVGLEADDTRPRVVANDVVGLVRSFRAASRRAGAEHPYFVADGSLMLVGDLRVQSPQGARSVAASHRDLDRALTGAVRLVHYASDALLVSRWFVPEPQAIVSIQTNVRRRDATPLPMSTLRIRLLDDARGELLTGVLATLDGLGWTFAREPSATVVWRHPNRAGLAAVTRVLGAVGVRLPR